MNQTEADFAELRRYLDDPIWRITSGRLYKIMVKSDDSSDGLGFVVPFVPNAAQMTLIRALHYRNLILKARQLGFTTLVAIIWLDHALFVSDQRCGIVAHDRDSAETIFRDKVKFAYERLPPPLLEAMPLARDSASELLFAHNNSSIRVATSMRSGTIHRLHVSEFGKIAAKYPEKATEVITGSIPSVPIDGILVIESTAEGAVGPFYEISTRAQALAETGKALTKRDYKFHFFPWFQNPEYRLDPDGVVIGEGDARYFQRIEGEIGQKLTPEQRAWYVATRDADYPGNPELMWREYPSTPDEAFQQSTEGCYYAQELAVARSQGRMCRIPQLDEPVNTFWDIGRSDQTAIWFHQPVGLEHRFIRYHEASGEKLGYFVKYLQDTGYLWGRHYLPHDAEHRRLSDSNKSIREMLEDLGLRDIEIVPRIDDVNHGIQQTRQAFNLCWFDEAGCKEGLGRLQTYRKRWNRTTGFWANEPLHDAASNGADAFRMFGQAMAGGMLRQSMGSRKPSRQRSWRAA
ncbi:MAG: hypothetical protein MZV65_39305 [Chromatiales bacterium]|nr:hypothetical protein [Chromatiales bacterium]